jgi:hypothetical protein
VDESTADERGAGFDIVFLPWRELGKLVGYVYESIIDEMIAGFDFVGTGSTLPAFRARLVPATFTVQGRELYAPLAQASLMSISRNIDATLHWRRPRSCPP